MRENLTTRQMETLSLLHEYVRDHGHSPTLKELAQKRNITASAVAQILEILIEKGFISKEQRSYRSMTITSNHKNFVDIPIIGNIINGRCLLSPENIVGYIPIDKKLIDSEPGTYFFLTAIDDSMNNASINCGDLILIKQTNFAESGAMVVAIINNQLTIKYLRSKGNLTVLSPDSTSSEYRPVIADRNFVVNGVVKEVISRELVGV